MLGGEGSSRKDGLVEEPLLPPRHPPASAGMGAAGGCAQGGTTAGGWGPSSQGQVGGAG